MKNLMFFLTLIGLLLVNFNAGAQIIEHYSEKNPRPENTPLEPVMFGAHGGKNFSIDEVRLAQTKGLNSHVPVSILEESDREVSRIEFYWLAEQQGMKFSSNQELDEWVQVEFPSLGSPNEWHENAFNFLGPVTAPEKIISLAYLSEDSPEADAGMKSIERNSFKRGERNYTNEDEMFVGLQLDRLSSNPVYAGVVIPRYSLGCGNRIMAFTPPKLNLPEPRLVVDPQQPRQSYLGTNWVVTVVEVQYVPVIQQAPQNFTYGGVGFQWGFNYNPCWWSPAVYYPTNCWGCMSYVPQSYGGGGYGGSVINEGDTYITNEGDQIINEGDIVIVNNNNNNNNPNPPTPDPDDDGGPVLPPNGDDDGGPVLGENGPVLGPNGNNSGSGNNTGNGGSNLGNSGMALESSGTSQSLTGKKTTTSFSDLAETYKLQAETPTPTTQRKQPNTNNSSLESQYWVRQKEAVFAQREQQQQTGSLPTGRTQPSQQIGNWTTQRQTNNSGKQSVRQNGGMSQQTTERKPQNFQTENQQRNPVGEWNQGSNQQMRQPATQQSSGSNAERYPVSGTQNRIPNTQRPSYSPQNNGGVTTARAPQVNSNSDSYSGNTGRIPSGVSSAPQGRQPVMSSPPSTMRTPSFNGGGMSGGMRSPGGMSGGGMRSGGGGMRTR